MNKAETTEVMHLFADCLRGLYGAANLDIPAGEFNPKSESERLILGLQMWKPQTAIYPNSAGMKTYPCGCQAGPAEQVPTYCCEHGGLKSDNARIVREFIETSEPLGCVGIAEANAALTALETELATAKADLERAREEAVMIRLGRGELEVADGNHGGIPALIFGKNGSGVIGEAMKPNRTMGPGEALAIITFGNPESLDVVQRHIDRLRDHFRRAALAPEQKG